MRIPRLLFGVLAILLLDFPLGMSVAAANSFVPANSPIDLTIPSPQQPLTDAEIFDESVIFAPNFAVNQNDPALSDLFGTNSVSNLCFPTSLAEVLISLYGYHQPKFSGLALDGLSSDSSLQAVKLMQTPEHSRSMRSAVSQIF